MTEARADALPSTPQRRMPHRELPDAGRLTYVLRQRFSYTYDAPVRDLDHRLVVVPPRRHGDQRRRRHSITVSAAGARTTHRRDAAGNIVTRSRVPLVPDRVEFVVDAVVERVGPGTDVLVPAAALTDSRLLRPTRLTAADAAEDSARLGSVGRAASPLVEVAVVDDDGARLPAGTVGEIVVRSAMSSSCYWQDKPPAADAFLDGGWFCSRDLGYLDRDRFLYYVDRSHDRIQTAHGSVYPHAVEEAVLRHHAVAACGAVGLGEPGHQEVVAAVVLKDHELAGDTLVEEIEGGAREALAEHAAPRVVVVESLPTVLGGAKVRRDALREQLTAAGAASR